MTDGAVSRLETQFKQHGTLRPPGPVGRLVRLGLAMVTLWPVVSIAPKLGTILELPTLPSHPTWWLGVALGLWLFPYVVNIGFTVSWGRWPLAIAAGVLTVSVLLSFAVTGASWSPVAGGTFYVWLVYTFGHLGISFLLASVIATPGCEMRAIPHLWTILTGHSTSEHYCPGVLDPIDTWEARRIDRRAA